MTGTTGTMMMMTMNKLLASGAGVRKSLAFSRPASGAALSGSPAMMQSERLAVLESQMAQLLADNRVFREGQVRSNTYNRHIIKKLEWLMRDAARRREESPLEPITGPSVLPKKRRRVVDSKEEREKEGEDKDGEGDKEVDVVEEEGEEPAPKKARSEKGKEREE
ncbi:MAG: hypothetical protein NXY57DRAFT_967712 [Lentinula lateritia]|nr:MAG: hypothetical protein NXY57DRAFT_967712 [Lentinula lateritia]